MKVIELITKLEEFSPDAEVMFEPDCIVYGDGSVRNYSGVVADVESYSTPSVVRLIDNATVRRRLKEDLWGTVEKMDLNKLQKLVLLCKLKIDDWVK